MKSELRAILRSSTFHRTWGHAMAGVMCAAAFCAPAYAQQQKYPVRPVRMIVPFSPGGATDVPGRIISQKLGEALGQQVVIDNRPGAGGTIGTDLAAKALPDGYTLLLTGTPHAISASLYQKLPYDPLLDFAPIMQVGSGPNVLVVHPAVPAKTVGQLIALARSQPGKIDFASSGNGSAQHLFGALFVSMADVKLSHIPYKGSAQATTDLIGGQVSVGFPGIAIALPHARSGRLRPLAVTSGQRSKVMPEIPTIDEAGVKGYEATLWLGIFTQKGTPQDIVNRVHDEVARILKSPEAEASFLATGTDVTVTSPERFAQFVRRELEKWARVIKAVGARAT